MSTVTWRQAAAAVVATVVGLLAIFVVLRADGLPAVDAASARATGWFVHEPSGRVVLVDGYRGVALGSIDTGMQGDRIGVAEGAPGAYLLNDTTAEARPIDTASMRLGTPFGVTTLGEGNAVSAVGQSGLVVVNPSDDEATVVPVDGEQISFPVDAGTAMTIGRDGAVWSLVDGSLVRTTSSPPPSATQIGVDDALLTTVGSDPMVVDVIGRRARFGDGDWHPLPTDAPASEIVVQQAGPASSCGWVAAGDDLWCVGRDGIDEVAEIADLDVRGGDLLAIAGDAGAVVHRGPSSIVRFDWRTGTTLEEMSADVASDAVLQVTATVDLVWIDDLGGDFVWAVNPWGIEAIEKNPQDILVLGENGALVDGASDDGTDGSIGDRSPTEREDDREPDDNGVDDPPVAVDDPVLARSRSSVTVEVTANDYDPDGTAVALDSVGVPGHGTVGIASASTLVYTPEPGYVGLDEFEYTIVDSGGASASASVVLELVAPDALNGAPIGVADRATTAAGVAVVVDVLLNDIDPERDLLQLGGFSPPAELGGKPIGEVTETKGPSELPALQFVPDPGFEGTAIFSYRPVDALGAVGDVVEVRVEVASADSPNRPPVARPDAVRVRHDIPAMVAALVNDLDPDNDDLVLTVVEPLPPGLDVDVAGDALEVTARSGVGPLATFEYEVDDLHGHTVRSSVLVSVIDDLEPNRPPIVTADATKAVAGEPVVIEVTANDRDPDSDPLTVTDVSQPDGAGRAVVFGRSQIQFTPEEPSEGESQTTVRFTYTVTDGQGHDVDGDVTVTVLPEALNEPPYARDDSTFTYVNVPVTVDVLRNDGDPSGGRPRLVGRPSCPAGGQATITTDEQVRFDPPTDATGAYRCTYEIANARQQSVSAQIIVSVRPALLTNRPPTAVNDSLTVEVGTSATVDLTSNDRDPDGDNSALKVLSSTAPVLGTAQRSGNVITFTAGDQSGIATISYQVADEQGKVSTGFLQVRITVRRNVAPIANPDARTVFGPAAPTSFSVLANDSDPDETPGELRVTAASKGTGPATVTVSGSLVTLTPPADFVGQIVANYTITDGGGMSSHLDHHAHRRAPTEPPPGRPRRRCRRRQRRHGDGPGAAQRQRPRRRPSLGSDRQRPRRRPRVGERRRRRDDHVRRPTRCRGNCRDPLPALRR